MNLYDSVNVTLRVWRNYRRLSNVRSRLRNIALRFEFIAVLALSVLALAGFVSSWL
ncbi:MAG: hypothetical protein MK010_01840 [Erythrobacter sp.]|nr:hypothetical protein [Erythrobacter sp.]